MAEKTPKTPIFIEKPAKLYQKISKLKKTEENAKGAEKYINARSYHFSLLVSYFSPWNYCFRN
jgi:hypothetical protein